MRVDSVGLFLTYVGFAVSLGLWEGQLAAAEEASSPVIKALDNWLSLKERPALADQAFAEKELTSAESDLALQKLWDDHVAAVKPALEAEWKQKKVVVGDQEMRFEYKYFGQKPKGGWNLFFGFHGGGGAPVKVNDSQWRNHLYLYRPKDSLYIVPRAPANSWDLWHVAQVDGLLDRIIEAAVLIEGVNPDKVYISGYSAGGDGVYQLAPRIADRLAAAAAMAGHPNETSPIGLRNIGFTIHVGENDSAYNRNKVALEWKQKLDDLHAADTNGYRHEVVVHKGCGHWVNLQDAVAMDWMATFTRNTHPEKIVWKQDNVTHSQFYWLAVADADRKEYSEITGERKGQVIKLSAAKDVRKITILLNDKMVDLDKPVQVEYEGKMLFNGKVPRTVATIARCLARKADPALMFTAAVTVDMPI